MNLMSDDECRITEAYGALCSNSEEFLEIQKLWPPSCARLRDPYTYDQARFRLGVADLHSFDAPGMRLSWIDGDSGIDLVRIVGLKDNSLEVLPFNTKRVDFLREYMKPFENICSNELSFIKRYTSSIVWLTSQGPATFGNASFYVVPHVTFVTDATLFFISPAQQLPRRFGGFGFIDNLYHEALHHQAHAQCAFSGQPLLKGVGPEVDEVLEFPHRQDREFTFAEAINACHVYRFLCPMRFRVLHQLERRPDTGQIEELDWLRDAASLSLQLWRQFSVALLDARQKFTVLWQDLIVQWAHEAECFSPDQESTSDARYNPLLTLGRSR
jgi:hypothetical protein